MQPWKFLVDEINMTESNNIAYAKRVDTKLTNYLAFQHYSILMYTWQQECKHYTLERSLVYIIVMFRISPKVASDVVVVAVYG